MDVNLRDGLILAVSTLPLSLAVTKVGLESGLHPLAIALASALAFSAAAQLLIYKSVAGDLPSLLALVGALGVAIRLMVYARDIHPEFADKPLSIRIAYLLPLTDISYLEYRRSSGQPGSSIRRYLIISRCLWSSWQLGTLTALLVQPPHFPFPKEGVSLLIFVCLGYAMLSGRRS